MADGFYEFIYTLPGLALLALLFLFAVGTKLILPLDVLVAMGLPNQVPLPGLFVRLIGVAEVLGAIGLLLRGGCASVRT